MNRNQIIFFILLLNGRLISMLKKNSRLLNFNEYFLDTCCSFNENEKMSLSCPPNEKIRLNLIQIYYNPQFHCSSEFSCCKYRTKCSRRITKYSRSHCDGENSCWIDKSCLKIFDSCSSIDGLYGQYLTIDYSCLSSNKTNSLDYEEVIVKLSTFDQTTEKSFSNDNSFLNSIKSSPIFFILIITLFLLLLFLTYSAANYIGKKICRKESFIQTNSISRKSLLHHSVDEKVQVQGNSSLSMTRIYPSYSNIEYYLNEKKRISPFSFDSYQRYIYVEHDPLTGQTYSRTFNPFFH